MRKIFILVVAALVYACNAQQEIPPQNIESSPLVPIPHDANRIKPIYIVTDDGYKMRSGSWDTKRNEVCGWRKREDGTLLCIPSFLSIANKYDLSVNNAQGTGYFDATCKNNPVYLFADLKKVPLKSCLFTGPILYVLLEGGSPICANPWYIGEVYPTSSKLFSIGVSQTISDSTPPLYFLDADRKCQPIATIPSVVSPHFYFPLTPIDFSEFAEGTLSTDS